MCSEAQPRGACAKQDKANVASGGQATFKNKLVTVSSYFAKKKGTVANLKKYL